MMASFFANFQQFFAVAFIGLLSTVGVTMGLNYLQGHNIKSNVENYMLDVMAYGTKHNGFNDPVNGNYTFESMNEDLIRRNKLESYLLEVKLDPEPGTQVRGRSGEISMQTKYKYPTINPLDPRETYNTSNSKVLTDVVHGYVKEHNIDKLPDFSEERPWWKWDDEEEGTP